MSGIPEYDPNYDKLIISICQEFKKIPDFVGLPDCDIINNKDLLDYILNKTIDFLNTKDSNYTNFFNELHKIMMKYDLFKETGNELRINVEDLIDTNKLFNVMYVLSRRLRAYNENRKNPPPPPPPPSSSSSSSSSKAPTTTTTTTPVVLVAKTPAQIATDFFNDPSIAKPALTASKSSSVAPATTAPVKDKYGLINKLLGTAAEVVAVNAVEQTLIEAAAGDTSHDFDDKKAISGITNLINTTYKDFYFSGLPGVTNLRNIQSEEQTIASVVQTNSYKFIGSNLNIDSDKQINTINNNFVNTPYSPLTSMKFIKEGIVPLVSATTTTDALPLITNGQQQDNGCTHEFKTVTGNDYTCTYFDVKPEKTVGTKVEKGEIIDAKQFFLNMGFRNEDNFNIGLIVDCVSITLEDIFNKGTPLSSGKQVRLVKSSEGENDPGGKTNINDKTFKTYKPGGGGNTGIDYKAAIPLNIDKNKKYTYYYDATQKTPYAWFLTNYRFSLSELQYSCKYLFSNLSTTLTITGEPGITPKVIPNSGEANEISQASIVIRNILERIKAKIKGTTVAQNAFDFNCPFQQKRSGDWLQALICALVAIGERQFCEFNPDIASIFKKKDLTTEAHGKAALKFTDVYLVTHDRILLAFALLLGINVIFTHHYKAAGKTYSYHSALVYKQKNPFEQLQAMNRVCQNFIEKITLPYVDEGASGTSRFYKAGPNDGYIYKLLEVIVNLEIVREKVKYQELYFKTKLDMAIEEPSETKEAITTATQNIFKEAFKLVMFNSSLPIDGNERSIDNFIIEIETLIEKFKKFLRLAGCAVDITNTNTATAKVCFEKPSVFSRATALENQPYFTLIDGKIITYDTILLLMGDYERIINQGTAIYNKLNSNVISSVPDKPNEGARGAAPQKITTATIKQYIDGDARTTSIKAFEKEIGKNTTFLLISGWYPATPKLNLWVQYTNVLPQPVENLTSAVINDKNVFLYNLVTLDDEFKIKICDKYIGIYETLKKNHATNGGMRPQAYESIMTFCFEVFINLGFRDTEEGKNVALKTRIDDFITLQNARDRLILTDRTEEMNALSEKETIQLYLSEPTAAADEPDLTFNMADIIVIPGAGVELALAGVELALAGGEGAKYDPVKSSDIVPTILTGIEKETQYTSLLTLIDGAGKFPEGAKTAATNAATTEYNILTKFTPSGEAAAEEEKDAEEKMETGVNIGSAEATATNSFAAAAAEAVGKGIDVIAALKSADQGEDDFIDEIMTGGGGTDMVGGRKDRAYNINIDGFYNRQPPTTIELVKIFSNNGLTTLFTTTGPEIYAAAQTIISLKLLMEEFVKEPVSTGEIQEFEGDREKFEDTIYSYITKIYETVPSEKINKVRDFLQMDVEKIYNEIQERKRLASSSISSSSSSSSKSQNLSSSSNSAASAPQLQRKWYIVNPKKVTINADDNRMFKTYINKETEITVNCDFTVEKATNIVINIHENKGYQVLKTKNNYGEIIKIGCDDYDDQYICSPINVEMNNSFYYFKINTDFFIISGNSSTVYIFDRDKQNKNIIIHNINSSLDTTKQGGGSNRLQKGGANIEEIKQKIENQSILTNEIFGSHPYKPIYFTLYSYCRELDVTDIEQSWDYEQFIQFFVIMNEMVDKMEVNLNTINKNENMNAVVSGYGLRELIFTSHQYIERDNICKTALKITNDDYYNSLSKMFSILVNRICGTVNQPMEEVVENNKYIENSIFTAYIQQIPFQKILDSNITDGIDVYELKNQANKLLLAIGECIITDTNGISSADNYTKLKGLTGGARAKYLLPNDSGNLASGFTELVGKETVNQLGNTLGNAIGDITTDFKKFTDAVTKEPEKIPIAIPTTPTDEQKPLTATRAASDAASDAAPSAPATVPVTSAAISAATMYSNDQAQKNNFMGFYPKRPDTPSPSFQRPIKVSGGTRKRRFKKVPKITRNQKLRKRKQTRNPRRKQTRRTNKRTRKHRN